MEESQLQFCKKGAATTKCGGALEVSRVEHEEPHPEVDEIMSFLAFHDRGLRFPVHPFLLGLLNEWGWSCNTST
jgi:hypothetical protein